MKKLVAVAMSGIFLLSLQGPGWAQKEASSPAVPPMLEEPRPFQEPEAKAPVAPKAEEKVKPKVKAKPGQKAAKKEKLKKAVPKARLAASTGKKKGLKTSKKTGVKKKKGTAKPEPQAAPDNT